MGAIRTGLIMSYDDIRYKVIYKYIMYIICTFYVTIYLYDPTDPGLPTRSGLLLGVTKMPLLPLRWADVAVVRLLLQHRAKVGNSHGNSPHERWVRQKLVGYHRFFWGFV